MPVDIQRAHPLHLHVAAFSVTSILTFLYSLVSVTRSIMKVAALSALVGSTAAFPALLNLGGKGSLVNLNGDGGLLNVGGDKDLVDLSGNDKLQCQFARHHKQAQQTG